MITPTGQTTHINFPFTVGMGERKDTKGQPHPYKLVIEFPVGPTGQAQETD